MLPRTKLGMLRVRVLGMSAPEFADRLRGAGCEVSLRRLRAIELHEVRPTERERAAIAKLLSVDPWEVQI